ncbi:site-specific integrase [Pseudomonas sp. GL-B-16]|uniref:site-specific integrase n=1 Tax=Pseudomonas sp. GL-B-16 TaxID=2832373 RepID=UPI001CBDDD61|nr:site-specific integrase [Pseudomonas sp. GL-B-16]
MAHLQELRAAGWRGGVVSFVLGPQPRPAADRLNLEQNGSGLGNAGQDPGHHTHSFRRLRLTHLARAGWNLHELSTYAGHRDPKTTPAYLHLSGARPKRQDGPVDGQPG